MRNRGLRPRAVNSVTRRLAGLTFGLALLLAWQACPAWARAPLTGGDLQQLQTAVNQAVNQIRPSVVCVRAQKRQLAQGGGEMWFESVGSGIVVDERGYILTNAHVIKDGTRITVGFWTQSNLDYTATVVDEDPALDLALLRVDTGGRLQPARIGDSSKLAMGEWVVSVGSPFGYEHSATLGVVSGLHRDLMINGVAYKEMIQTDATINQGNSGGPLLDSRGVVVGVSAAIFTPDKAYTGIGFAIPINRAKHFISKTTGAIPVVRTTPSASGPQAGFQPLPQGLIAQTQATPPLVVQPSQTVQVTTPQGFQPLPQVVATPQAQPAPAQNLPAQNVKPIVPAAPVLAAAPAAKPQPAASPAPAAQAPAIQAQAQPAAAVASAPLKTLEPVDLTKKPPNDATHEKFSDCTICHTFTKKLVANMSTPMPHPPIGACDACHILVNEKVVKGPTTVAWTNVLTKIPGAESLGKTELAVCLGVLLAAMAAVALGLDAGLLFMPLLLLLGAEFRLAAALSLILSAVIAIPASLRFMGVRLIDQRLILWAALPAAIGGLGGGLAAGAIPPTLLPIGLCCALLLAAVFGLRDPELGGILNSRAVTVGRTGSGGLVWRRECGGVAYGVEILPAAALVAVSGLSGAMFGVSGSWLLIPALMSVFGAPLAMAGAVAAVTAPIVGLSGYFGHALAGYFNHPLLVPLCIAALGGAVAGLFFPRSRFKTQGRLAGVLLLGATGVWMLWRIATTL